jgi:predicted nucleotidyltransferase component of viral defense system
MNKEYVDTVRLVLAIAPAVFQSPRFALKGGAALNLFLHDMPRLSVDIDVVFTDHARGREEALRPIAVDLKAAETAISGFRSSWH